MEYLIHNHDFLNAVPDSESQKEDYREALSYVKKNGVKVYSIITFASPEKILKIHENPEVATISIMDVKVSKYSK